MRRVTAMVSAAAVVLWMATAFAQGPNLAERGRETCPPAQPAAAVVQPAVVAAVAQRGGGGGGGGAFNCGMECTIVMDAKTVTIKRPANAQGTVPADIVLNSRA